MSSLQSNRHIPFTNSAQRQQQQHLLHSQQLQQQSQQQMQVQQQSQQALGAGGFPQSLSGSETDISTSNENLSHEERYVIRHTARQEPQGQENMAMLSSSQSSPNSNRSSLSAKLEGAGMTGGNGSGSNRSSLNRPDNSSNRSSLDVSSSSYNTLIIHGTLDESWPGRLSGIRDIQDQSAYGSYSSGVAQESSSPSSGSGNNSSKDLERDRDRSAQWYGPSLREIIDIPDDFLSQSQVLKHLAKEVKVYRSTAGNVISRQSPDTNQRGHQAPSEPMKRLSLEHRGGGGPSQIATNVSSNSTLKEETAAPPQYSGWPAPPLPNHLKNGGIYPLERMALSRSQPDLSRIGEGKLLSAADIVGLANNRLAARDDERTAPVEMVDMLIHENNFLRHELNECSQKVSRSIKLEQEIQKVHRAQEELVASCERRERLERVARARLQSDCRRIQEVNRALREQLEMVTSRNISGSGGSVQSDQAASVEALKRDVGKREVLIAQLITQNKELSAAKERQEIELAAQRVTLQEQRTHINILDTALQNAQSNVVRLEEECRKKQLYVERVAQLQRVLSSLQLASDRREQGERKLRMQLERELRNERARAAGAPTSDDLGANSSESAAELKRKLREREGKIMLLEGEVAKWEQRYLEESSLRQAAIDAASLPKDAKIAALEKTSQETEKLIAEARTEKIRHMDEVHAAQKRVTDLESRLKDLESKLAERDAMIRVLQKHTCKESKASTSSSYPSIIRSPHHTPHPSLNADLGVLGCSVSREELGPVYSSSSPAFNSSNQSYSSSVGDGGYHHSASGSYSKFGTSQSFDQSFDQTKKCLDDELKELDSQLDSQLDSKMLSKRGLCCFPGFSNPSSAARKGKVSQPLLASVGVGVWQGLVAQSRYEAARPEEMLLLEKQGLSSQQQRMPDSLDVRSRSGSLPPSSLPRPRRSHGSRRLGEYGRLSDGERESTRKTSTNSSLDGLAEASSKGRDSLPPMPRKLGEYGRLSDSESGRKMSSNSNDSCKVINQESSSRSYLPPPRKLSDYGKLSANSSSDGSVDIVAKTRDSPARFLPSPRKLSDSSRTSEPERKSREAGIRDSGTSEDSSGSKLRLIPTASGRVLSAKRASSLQRETSKPTHPSESGLRSLPTSNKYRVQF